MAGRNTLRVCTCVGFGLFLVVGLLPSALYGGYMGLLTVRFVLHLEDASSPTAKVVLATCAGVSIILTCALFTFGGRAIGRSILRRQTRAEAGALPAGTPPEQTPPA